MIAKLHYISQETGEKGHLENIDEACAAGVNWVQLRVKDKPVEEIERMALGARAICELYGTRLIINDHVEIARSIGADGVHLGKEDIAPDEARKILGQDAIIGGTANSLDDIRELIKAGVDYIGLGPYRFTSTKQKLSPVLGLEGYKHLMSELTKMQIQIPVVAIGGIQVSDIPPILNTGIYGVAVASLINNAPNKKEITLQILNSLKNGKA